MRLAASSLPGAATEELSVAMLDVRAATNRMALAIACGAQNLSFAPCRMAPTTRDEARAAADRFNARSMAPVCEDDGDDDECASGAADESRKSSYDADTPAVPAPALAEAATPAPPAPPAPAPAEVEAEYEADRAEAGVKPDEEDDDSAAAASFSARKAWRTRAAHAATTRANAISCAPSLSRHSTADRR